MTRKLYYEDPYLREFSARVTARGVEADGTPYVVLDQTCFYPTGGGQPCDLGQIEGVDVLDVEEVAGQIHHRLAAPVTNETVRGAIDWARRFDHMQQHNGQHILSAAAEHLYDVDTVGFHLGRETVTVDLAFPDLTQPIVDELEYLANQVVFDNRAIEQRFVTDEELRRYPLRKQPTVRENVRLVIIPDFDYNGCGGTHPHRTGETGPIKILSWERYKGNVRVTFVCGWRALRELREKQLILRTVARQLTSGEAELEDKVARLLHERKELDKALSDARLQLLDAEAEQLWHAHTLLHGVPVVAHAFAERSMQELQRLAGKLAEREAHALVLLVAGGAKTQLVFARGSAATVPMNELLKDTLQLIAGKGGGQPSLAQGGGDTSQTPAAVLAHALELADARLLHVSTT